MVSSYCYWVGFIVYVVHLLLSYFVLVVVVVFG